MYLSVLYIKQILHVTMCANVFHVTLYFENSHMFTIAKNNEFSLLHAVTNFAQQKSQFVRPNNQAKLFCQNIVLNLEKQNYMTRRICTHNEYPHI